MAQPSLPDAERSIRCIHILPPITRRLRPARYQSRRTWAYGGGAPASGADPAHPARQLRRLDRLTQQATHDETVFSSGAIHEWNPSPILGTGGATPGQVWKFHDVTQRRHAEARLRGQGGISQCRR
jgi:hypothetical protein